MLGRRPAHRPPAVRRRVGLLGHANGLYDDLTVADNVRFWARPSAPRGRGRRRPGPARARPAASPTCAVGAAVGRPAPPDLPRRAGRPPAGAVAARRAPRRARRRAAATLVDELVRTAAAAGATVLVASHELERAAGARRPDGHARRRHRRRRHGGRRATAGPRTCPTCDRCPDRIDRARGARGAGGAGDEPGASSVLRDAALVAGKDLRIECAQPGRAQPGAALRPARAGPVRLRARPRQRRPRSGRRPACSGSPSCSAALLAVQRSFAIEAADGDRDAPAAGRARAGRHLPRQGRRRRRSSCWRSRSLLGVGVVLLYDAPTWPGWLLLVATVLVATVGPRRRRYALRRARGRGPGPGDAAAAPAPPGRRAGPDRCHPSLRGGARHRRSGGRGLAWVGCSTVVRRWSTSPSASWPSGRFWRNRDRAPEPTGPGGATATPGPTRRARLGPAGTRCARGCSGCSPSSACPLLLLLGLVASPPDVDDGRRRCASSTSTCPSASLAYLAFGVTARSARVLYLWKRTRSWWDRVAGAVGRDRRRLHRAHARRPACSGAGRRGACTGRGTPASPPPRCCSCSSSATSPCGGCRPTAEVRAAAGGHRRPARLRRRADRAPSRRLVAVAAPGRHLVRRDLNAELDGLMLFTLCLRAVRLPLIFVWLLMHRFRVAWLRGPAVARPRSTTPSPNVAPRPRPAGPRRRRRPIGAARQRRGRRDAVGLRAVACIPAYVVVARLGGRGRTPVEAGAAGAPAAGARRPPRGRSRGPDARGPSPTSSAPAPPRRRRGCGSRRSSVALVLAGIGRACCSRPPQRRRCSSATPTKRSGRSRAARTVGASGVQGTVEDSTAPVRRRHRRRLHVAFNGASVPVHHQGGDPPRAVPGRPGRSVARGS